MSAKSSMVADLKRLQERLQSMPEAVSYIVLDHAVPPVGHIDSHDAKGRRYLHLTPAVLDQVRYVRVGEEPLDLQSSMFGIPIFRREDLPKEWPDA